MNLIKGNYEIPNSGTPIPTEISHTTPIRKPGSMGSIWEASGNGVTLSVVPGESLKKVFDIG